MRRGFKTAGTNAFKKDNELGGEPIIIVGRRISSRSECAWCHREGFRRSAVLASTAGIAICAFFSPAHAGSYTASNETELRSAILAANAESGPSTIILTGNIAIATATAFPALTNSVTINTGAFTLSGADIPSGAGDGGSLTFPGGALLTTSGAVRGGNAATDTTTGLSGVGGTATVLSNGSLQNSGTMTGGAGGGRHQLTAGAGGVGANLTNSALVNQGTIAGGVGGNTNSNFANFASSRAGGAGGVGLIMSGGSLNNQSQITGGDAGGVLNMTANADNWFGGAGGTGAQLTGGTHTSSGTITGGDGGVGRNGVGSVSGAGPGGAGLVLSGTASFINDGTVTGGNGVMEFNSGRGSGGGAGAVVTNSDFVNTSTVAGGTGVGGTGAGASSNIVNGLGGTGLVLTNSTATNSGTIVGGAGGGFGGDGLTLANSTITNSGTIAGGTGGVTGGVRPGGMGVSGIGGASVITSGAISGGVSGDGLTRSNAVTFTNGGNRLELQAGHVIDGNAVATVAGGDTLALGGSTNSTFAASSIGATAQYRNFSSYHKVGTSTWTLIGTTAETTSWQLFDGILSVSSDGNLGAAAGTVTFDGGTLQNTAALATSRTMTINAGGGTFQTDASLTVSSAIGGMGALTKTGGGSMILTAANTYTGGTAISAGTLQLGDGGVSGSIAGNVLNNGTLAFNRSDTVTFGGLISGTGAVDQIGTGTTILTGDNSYTGVTTIVAGTLQLGNGGTSGSIAGAIVNNAALSLNRSDTFLVPAAISGTGTVTQDGAGTTVFTGNNTYTGGTTINAGSLQIGNGGTSGSIVGNVTNNAALTFNRSDSTAFGGIISGAGSIRQIGSGLTNLTGDSSGFAGTTSVEAGKLAVNGSLCGNMNVLAGGRLQGTGTVCDTTNFAGGTIAPGNSIGTITVAGNYVGNGGLLEIETVLGGDASPTDRLVVTGDTSGSTFARVINRGGLGAPTVEGIKIVDVGGASNGTFTLQGDYTFLGQSAVIGGAYAYLLQKNGISTPNDGDWYLRSNLSPPADTPGIPPEPPPPSPGPIFQPAAPVVESYARVMLNLNELPTMQQRIGHRFRSGPDAMASIGAPNAVTATLSPLWARVEGGHKNLNPVSTARSNLDLDHYTFEGGADVLNVDSVAGRLLVGVVGNYVEGNADIFSLFGNGRVRVSGGGVGGTVTWLGNAGFYFDGQGRASWYNGDLTSLALGRITSGNDGFGHAFGAEVGHRLGIGNGWSITPQLQVSYSNVDFDTFADRFGAQVKLSKAESLLGRGGFAINHQDTWRDASGQVMRSDVYGIANAYYEFLDGTAAVIADTTFASKTDQLWGSIGAGGTFSWADNRYALYGEISYSTSLNQLGDSYSYKGTAGFRMRW